jgi:hypothetical protein
MIVVFLEEKSIQTCISTSEQKKINEANERARHYRKGSLNTHIGLTSLVRTETSRMETLLTK